MATTFHLFPNLPLTLQADILAAALPPDPVLISAFWTSETTDNWETNILRLPTTRSFQTLQNIGQLQFPLLRLFPVHLKHTPPPPQYYSGIPASIPIPSSSPPPALQTIYLRPSIDILYLPHRLSMLNLRVRLDMTDFLAREENQRMKRIGITLRDFAELHASRVSYGTVALERRTIVGQLILGLRRLEEVYVIGGDEEKRLFLPLEAQDGKKSKVQKVERQGGLRGLGGRLGARSVLRKVFGKRSRTGIISEYGERDAGEMGLEKWTGEGEIELVGEGEGTFQKLAPSYAGYGNSEPSPTSIEGIEECWECMVEVEKRNQGKNKWRAPRVVGYEVKCEKR
jgi:hypothetical protein